MKLYLIVMVACSILTCLGGCGRADFSANTDFAPDIAVPVVTTGVDFYLEIEQEFSSEISGKVDLSQVLVNAMATWPGLQTLQLELRASLTGPTAGGQVSTDLSKPTGWDTAIPIVSLILPAGATSFKIVSANLKDAVTPILEKGQFWIQGRLRYGGLDLGRTLTLKTVFVHAEGSKNLSAFAPLINLGF